MHEQLERISRTEIIYLYIVKLNQGLRLILKQIQKNVRIATWIIELYPIFISFISEEISISFFKTLPFVTLAY